LGTFKIVIHVTGFRYNREESITAFDDLNSAEFLVALHEGSAAAFDSLVDRLLPHLTRFLAFGKRIPEADAEELASDVLMTVHQKIGTFRHGGRAKLTTWIFEIAKNRAIDYYRASSGKPEIELPPDMPQQPPHEETLYAGRNRALLEWLLKELDELSEQDQWLLKWRALEIPYLEIAQWLGIGEGTARVRHKRAMEKLLAKAAERAVQKGVARP
jgi:RNA polymerase sigma-70 factor, ECF subfamily